MARASQGHIVSEGAPRAWVEITKSEHQHGGPGWQFGTCLWSPTRNKSGRASYRIMQDPAPGEEVLHFYEHRWPDQVLELRFCGWSHVASRAEIRNEPPIAGEWAGQGDYYRIDLREFTWARKPIGISRFLQDYAQALKPDVLNKPKFYPFYEYGRGGPLRLIQGGYLTRATPLLRQMLFLAVEEIAPDEGIPDGPADDDFAEGRRKSRETFFFARNRQLAERARAVHGIRCMVCQFDFGENYGEAGRGYVECHHLDPLSERSDRYWDQDLMTNVRRVAIVCSNCHRIIHRRHPAYSLEQVIAFRKKARRL